jgi:hypothetical protein
MARFAHSLSVAVGSLEWSEVSDRVSSGCEDIWRASRQRHLPARESCTMIDCCVALCLQGRAVRADAVHCARQGTLYVLIPFDRSSQWTFRGFYSYSQWVTATEICVKATTISLLRKNIRVLKHMNGISCMSLDFFWSTLYNCYRTCEHLNLFDPKSDRFILKCFLTILLLEHLHISTALQKNGRYTARGSESGAPAGAVNGAVL